MVVRPQKLIKCLALSLTLRHAVHRTLLDESDQRDLAPGIPLASSPAATTPLMDRLLAARRGDLAPGLPITPAPSSQLMGGAMPSGDLDLAPGAPITPAPSQALSSRMPSRAGSMPSAPPPTPAEVRPMWTNMTPQKRET